MGWPQTLSGVSLIAAVAAVAGYFLYHQIRVIRQLATDTTFSLEELAFNRRQAYRRFAAGVVMLLLAVLLIGALLFLEAPAQALADERDTFPDPETRPPLTPEQKAFARVYGWYWLVILVLLLVLVVLGGWDYLALRRFGRQQRRNIDKARREMIARERNRLRGP